MTTKLYVYRQKLKLVGRLVNNAGLCMQYCLISPVVYRVIIKSITRYAAGDIDTGIVWATRGASRSGGRKFYYLQVFISQQNASRGHYVS